MSTTTKQTVELAAAAGWVTVYRHADSEIKRMQAVKDEARRHIEEELGDAEVGQVDGTPVVKWTWYDDSRIDVAKVREQAPELAEACTVTTPRRRFTVEAAS